MPEWWTYAPQDLLMFAPETYYRLFAVYNAEIWPAQVLAGLAALLILGLLVRPMPWAGRAIAALLAAGWAFVAWAYFHERYATINLAATYYAWLFAAQSLLLLVTAALNRLTFQHATSRIGKAGRGVFIFALIGYPLIATILGRPWLQVELFGVAPDPTVFGTFGVLAAADRMRWELTVIPAIWCAITVATLWTMGSPDALIILAAPLCAAAIAVIRIAERRHVGS